MKRIYNQIHNSECYRRIWKWKNEKITHVENHSVTYQCIYNLHVSSHNQVDETVSWEYYASSECRINMLNFVFIQHSHAVRCFFAHISLHIARNRLQMFLCKWFTSTWEVLHVLVADGLWSWFLCLRMAFCTLSPVENMPETQGTLVDTEHKFHVDWVVCVICVERIDTITWYTSSSPRSTDSIRAHNRQK